MRDDEDWLHSENPAWFGSIPRKGELRGGSNPQKTGSPREDIGAHKEACQEAEIYRRPPPKYKGASLVGADLSELDLTGIFLEAVDLSGADLRDTNLSHSNLSGCLFVGSDMRGASLFHSLLERADLRKADLREACLIMTNFYEAKLKGAKLPRNPGSKLCRGKG